MDARYASCRSPVGPAGSYHCHGLRRIPRHLCSLCSSCVPFRVGTAPHATAKHDSPAPPRRARPTPRVPRRSQAVRSSLNWCAPRDRAHFRLRARRVARVVHAETARVRPEAEPQPRVSPHRRVADLHASDRRWPPWPPPRRDLWKKNPRLAGAHGFHADGRGDMRISTREPRVGGGTTRIASDRRWPPWPPWPPLGSDPPKNIFSSWSVGVLTSGHPPRYFYFL